MAVPWKTSNDIVEAVKRTISFPISQNTFDEEDILEFANDELLTQVVPGILSYHEEYFVVSESVAIEVNKSRYPIPHRAIGMRLRDLFWQDEEGNLFEMSKISPEDKAYFQRNVGAGEAIHKYYVEGNDVVLSPQLQTQATGSLVFVYFQRPNSLVPNDRAAIISSFSKTITVTNGTIVAGNTVTIEDQIFTAVAGTPSANQFQIGGTSATTASNLASAITSNGIVAASVSSNIITLTYTNRKFDFTTTNTTGFAISVIKVNFTSIPSHIVVGSRIDFLQTLPGHRIIDTSVTIPAGGLASTTISFASEADVPEELVVGDYICQEFECIIPQIPTDLHDHLVERTSAKILAAIGDQQGLQTAQARIDAFSAAQGSLIDSRVEGSPTKVIARHSLLRFGKMSVKRRI